MFSGSIPALVTPFKNGNVDYECLEKLIKWHASQGSAGLVICGTTGECPTLSHREHIDIVAHAVKCSDGAISIIAGAGSNSTNEALELTVGCEAAGANGLLHVTGYYNKPTQRQVISHFMAINNSTRLPIIVYNIPSRTGQELSVETVAELSSLSNVIAVKDSTGNVSRVTSERAVISKPFSFLSGDDATALGYIAHGGVGCISVTANVAPRMVAKMIDSAISGDFRSARELQDKLMPLHRAIFLEPSPSGIKYAMARFNLCSEEIRLPLSKASESARREIDEAVEYAGLS